MTKNANTFATFLLTTFYSSHANSQFFSILFIFVNYVLPPFLNDFNTIIIVNNFVLLVIPCNESNKIVITTSILSKLNLAGVLNHLSQEGKKHTV